MGAFNMEIHLNIIHLLLPIIAFIIWLVRLESKVNIASRDINGLGKKVREMDVVLRGDLKGIEINIARIETMCGLKHEHIEKRNPYGEGD